MTCGHEHNKRETHLKRMRIAKMSSKFFYNKKKIINVRAISIATRQTSGVGIINFPFRRCFPWAVIGSRQYNMRDFIFTNCQPNGHCMVMTIF